MLNIIKSDLYRIFKQKAIYIVIAILIFLALVSSITMSPGNIGISMGSTNLDINDTEFIEQLSNVKSLTGFRDLMKSKGAFPLDKDIIGNNANMYYFFIVVVVIVLVTDFSNKSIKNTLSSAITRKKYYFSKLILILVLGTILILFNNYINYFFNLIINGNEFVTPILEFTKLSILQLPLLYGMISLLVCIACIFRKTSLFNTISIPFVMVVQLIGMAIINIFKIKADWFLDYEFQFALSNLVNNPTNQYVITCTVIGIIYIIVFNVIGYYAFKKAEIR